MTRKITPHKGGRTERLYPRATPDDKALLERLSEEHGVTMSDIIAVAINALVAEFNPVERHLMIHGVESSDYKRNREDDSSYTMIVFGDGAKLEQWYNGRYDSEFNNTQGWLYDDMRDFVDGWLFEEYLPYLFTDEE